MHISSGFDAGNIKVISLDDPQDIRLEIITDNQSEFYQWFYFRLSRVRATSCRLKIINAGGAAYPDGFQDYRVLYSYDRRTWRRHPTVFADGVLSWDFTPAHDIVYFSYFTPYSTERHHDLLTQAVSSPLVRHCSLGKTLDGADIDLLVVENKTRKADDKLLNCWLIARQHPGETMAEWWMEGLLEKLLDENDPTARELLQRCCFHIVPNMNPDG
ncbi:MAG: M14-type cytosolic carboxypeptidase, partial [Pseudohongiellaceae bacterium]